MNFNYKHIIWDWNGTLIDDAWLCLEIINGLLRRRNMREINITDYQELFNFPVINFYEKIGFNFSKEPFKIPAAEYIEAYNSRRFGCKLHQGVLEALSLFKESGITHSVLSASKQSSLEEAIKYYSLQPYFTNVCGLNDHYAHSKIEIGRNHLLELEISGEQVVIIGDTTHDYEVAKSLGIDCILVNGGHHSRKKLEQCSVRVLNSISELKSITLISV
ncbi:MAG: HAD family hydrolase [Spirochaetota bacterium]